MQPPKIERTGYVLKTLEAAVWAFDRNRSFEEGALAAANPGNDADITRAAPREISATF